MRQHHPRKRYYYYISVVIGTRNGKYIDSIIFSKETSPAEIVKISGYIQEYVIPGRVEYSSIKIYKFSLI